jgi:hypothetical protein
MMDSMIATPPVSSRGLSPGPMAQRVVLWGKDFGVRRALENQLATVSADRWVPGTSPGMTVVGGLARQHALEMPGKVHP